jgi:hypothetical protein
MPTPSEMRQWTRIPLSKWFLDQLNLRYGNIDAEWRGITNLDDLNKNKGKAEVLDLITQLITEPQLFDPVTPPE